MATLDHSLIEWRKSTRSSGNGNCVEFADFGKFVAIRDTKDRVGPTLTFTAAGWRAFVERTKDGAFDG
jgi:hypothetical protein